MNMPRTLEFEGHDEELEKHILEFARAVGGGAARDLKRGGWVVSAGTPFSTNPNTLLWKVRIARQGNIVKFAVEHAGFRWTLSKRTRVAHFRLGQFADFLEGRLRGRDAARLTGPRFREPFVSGFGAEPAALSASLAWSAACGLGSCALSLLACMLPALLLMNVSLGDTLGRTAVIESVGTAALPRFTGIVSFSWFWPWGSALLFALPLAFFLSLVHTLALLAGEIWTRASRLGLASVLFQAIFLGMAFLPVLGWLNPLPIIFLVPLATHAGYTMVWGRRGERVREEDSPRRSVRAAAVVLTLAVLAMLIPRPAGEQAYRDRMALFRDRFLLGSAAGRAVATFYYDHTLAAAEPLKEFYSMDPERRPMRLQRTVGVKDERLTGMFRALDFTVAIAPASLLDVICEEGRLVSGAKAVPWSGRMKDLPVALDQLSEQAFRASGLRDLSALSWRAVFYAGPVVALLMAVGFLSLGVAVVFRKLPRRAAVGAMAGSFAVAVGFMLHDYSRNRETHERMEALRSAPSPERIAAGLSDRAWAVRHEAAFQAFHGSDPAALTVALLRAADDPDLRVRLWACGALGKTRDARTLSKLLERLDDPEMFVRYRAAEGLGFLGRQEAVEPLERMMRERGWYEGAYALQALRRIKLNEFR